MRGNPLLSQLLYGQVEKSFYQHNRTHLAESNYRTIRIVFPIGVLLLSLLLVLTYAVDPIHGLHSIYWLAMLAYLTLTVLAYTAVAKHHHWATPLYYVFAVITNMLAIYLGACKSPETAATIFFTFLIITPVLVLDKPIRPLLLSLSTTVVFCLATAQTKAAAPLIVETDILDAVYSFLMGACFTYFIINTRLQSLQTMQVMKMQAETDQLTGLTNKDTTECLCRLYLHQPRSSGLALLVLDIDHFKAINDRFGHQMGDAVLRQVGDALIHVFRGSDIVGRIGGDEFCVLMRDVNTPAIVARKAGEIQREISRILLNEHTEPVSCSIGIVTAGKGASDYQQLFLQADSALYQSKKAGRDRYTFAKKSYVEF